MRTLALIHGSSVGAIQHRPSHGPLSVVQSSERKRRSNCSVLFHQQLRTTLYKQNISVTHSYPGLGKEPWLCLYCALYCVINGFLICTTFNLFMIMLLWLLSYAPVSVVALIFSHVFSVYSIKIGSKALMLGLFVQGRVKWRLVPVLGPCEYNGLKIIPTVLSSMFC